MSRKLSKGKREQIKSIVILCHILVVFLIVVILGGSFVCERIVIHNEIKDLVATTHAGYSVKDFSARADDINPLTNNYFSVDIPKEYISVSESANPMVAPFADGEKSIVVFMGPTELGMQLTNLREKDAVWAGIEQKELERMVAKLGYGEPDSYYQMMKAAILLDREDYSFWSKEKQIGFAVLATLKKEYCSTDLQWLYEREQVGAIVSRYEGTQYYVVEMADTRNPKQVFLLYLNNVEENVVWELLNSVKFY